MWACVQEKFLNIFESFFFCCFEVHLFKKSVLFMRILALLLHPPLKQGGLGKLQIFVYVVLEVERA